MVVLYRREIEEGLERRGDDSSMLNNLPCLTMSTLEIEGIEDVENVRIIR
jgi:hypothetical protein